MGVLGQGREAAALEFMAEPRRDQNVMFFLQCHLRTDTNKSKTPIGCLLDMIPVLYRTQLPERTHTLDNACLKQALAGDMAKNVLATSCETSSRRSIVVQIWYACHYIKLPCMISAEAFITKANIYMPPRMGHLRIIMAHSCA